MSRCGYPQVPPKDGAFSNLATSGLVTACHVAARTLIAATEEVLRCPTEIVTLTEQAGASATYTLKPNASNTIFRFASPLTQNKTLTMLVDTSASQLGDEMIWMMVNGIQPVGDSSKITIHLGPTLFFAACGSKTENMFIPSGTPSRRIAQYWVFDGAFWVYTGDNC